MISKQANPMPMGQRIWSVLLALVLGALLPVVTLLQITMLLPVLMLGGIFLIFLHSYGGWPASTAFIVAGLGATAWFAGTDAMWMLLAAAMMPGAITLRGIGLKQPFFTQLRNSIAAYVLGLLAAMGIVYLRFGGGMVVRIMDLLRQEFAAMPDSALQPLVDAFNSALTVSGMQSGKLTLETYRSELAGMLDLMQRMYAQSLPGTLLSGAVLSGAISTLWGNWRQARRGMATNESFAGMSRWFLPPRVTVGALVMCAAGFIIARGGYANGATVYATALYLSGTLFGIQAIAALDRRMLDSGRTLTRRRVLLTLLIIGAMAIQMIATFLFVVGAASALFGSHGAVRAWRDKRRDDDSHFDDHD